MGDGAARDGDLDHVFGRIANGLLDGLGDLYGFTHPHPHMARTIPDHDHNPKPEALSALGHLAYTTDLDDLIR